MLLLRVMTNISFWHTRLGPFLSLPDPGLPQGGVPLVGAEVRGVLRVCHSEKGLNEGKNILKSKLSLFYFICFVVCLFVFVVGFALGGFLRNRCLEIK